ncbi:class I SAM-dependent methyltransferase [Ectothiorhodospira variabilis]|uniref:class I SAM-dependent methyltransferase n=1 Tax=Ectothiorhodospira variabilis TaxID=505694 RepID=UPI001EFB351C|nr:class I SAM-dependent methyltransferase [Ectothiorhodospira variabilis]MCG5495835.1 class I SAM-dependent methyltransferase [Ectothiorhodospira variabilis]MCG5504536.1 class I SAM-dependent methyltransferase [Ectothiorhodospira variabilis]MCG5507757.1 class I SAM-dependent methyltransferase [Ectothiorhodospira variabilis]
MKQSSENGAVTSASVRGAYTAEYFLEDCGGYETYKQSGGKVLDIRLECMARLGALKLGASQVRVLDLGCGRGEIARYFAAQGCLVDAVDYSPQAIELAEACFEGEPSLRQNTHFVCGSVTDPKVYQGGYDLVLASDLIEHLAPQELDELYSLVRRHLKPDGLFAIHTFPNHWFYRFGYPRRRREAELKGESLPSEPRSPYELQMHINEQTPTGMRKQLASHFEHVLLWGADHHNPAGSLQKRFSKSDWRDAPSLFALAARRPLERQRVIDVLGARLEDSRHPDEAVAATAAATVPEKWSGSGVAKRLVRQLRRIPGVRKAIDILSGVYHLPRLRHELAILMKAHHVDGGDQKRLMGWYQAFEDAFRGPPEVIRERLRVYLPYIVNAPVQPTSPLLDLGCGRGDWLSLLAETGISARGVDTHPDALVRAEAQGLLVTRASAVEYLAGLPNASLGAITAFHLLEHLPFETLLQLLEEAHRVLEPGGVFIFETPNPENLSVGACHFYADPTHQKPLLPEVMAFTLAHVGFTAIETLRLNPVASEHHIQEQGNLPHRFNTLFYGPRDFALVAKK